MTVTALLMPGHEMALPLIMTERVLEERGKRGNSSDLDRMLGGSWRGEKEEEEEKERK